MGGTHIDTAVCVIDQRYYALSMAAQRGPRLGFGSVLHARSWFAQGGREVRGAVLIVVHCAGCRLGHCSLHRRSVVRPSLCQCSPIVVVVFFILRYTSVVFHHCRELRSAVVVIRHARRGFPCRSRPICRDGLPTSASTSLLSSLAILASSSPCRPSLRRCRVVFVVVGFPTPALRL
jgi:hypothetical protein